MNTALIHLIFKYWLIFLHFSEQSSKQTLSHYFFLNMFILFRTCFSIFPHKFAQKNRLHHFFLSFWKCLFMSFHFSPFCWDVIRKKNAATFVDPWLMFSAVYFGMFSSFFLTNVAKTTRLHHFSPVFYRFLLLSFQFFAFLLKRVAKKTRLHFWGVKWQKLWGILCFRASMKIHRK